jgi:hypothetical protein
VFFDITCSPAKSVSVLAVTLIGICFSPHRRFIDAARVSVVAGALNRRYY